MQEHTNVKTSKKNLAILILVIIGAAIILSIILLSIYCTILEYNKPIDPDARYNLNFGPLFLMLAVYSLICLAILLPLGIATYKKPNKACSIALLVLGILSGTISGFLCVAAAIVALVQVYKEKKQSEQLQTF